MLSTRLEWQTHLHLCLFNVGVDHGCHVAEGGFPRLPVEQNTVQDLEQLLLNVRQSGKGHTFYTKNHRLEATRIPLKSLQGFF